MTQPSQWGYKLVYYRYSDGDWRPSMVDSMPMLESDDTYGLPMPDHLDKLGMDKWELVTAVPVDDPDSGLLLLIFKRPRE